MNSRLAAGGLYVITDCLLTPGAQLLPAVGAALRGGAGMVQYRSKSADTQQREAEARALLALCREHSAPLIINDDVALAARIGADGVHLGRDDGDVAWAREQLGGRAIIGISGYANPQAVLTPEADYIAFGRLFDSPTKPEASPAALEVFQQARGITDKPLVGIGGINHSNATEVIEAGANWLAMVSGVFAGPDIENNARKLCRLIRQQI